MNKFNPFEHHEETQIKQLQVVFLSHECGLSNQEIANITEYAVGTVRIYIKKYAELLELAKSYFDINIKISISIPSKNSIVATENILYRTFKDGRPAVTMEFMPGCGANIKGEEAVYFFKFYNANGLEFNKVGTSAKDVVARLRDEIGEYSKKFDIRRVEIHRIMSCGNRPAEGAESALRAELIRQYPNAFRKNDRFFGVDISPAVFDEIMHNYFG